MLFLRRFRPLLFAYMGGILDDRFAFILDERLRPPKGGLVIDQILLPPAYAGGYFINADVN